jgi:hypothetical protein
MSLFSDSKFELLTVGGGAIVVFIFIFLSGFWYDITYFMRAPATISITFLIFICSIIGTALYCILRRKYIYKIGNNYNPKNAELYYSIGMGIIKTIGSASIVGLSILWGFVVSGIGSKGELFSNLVIQTNTTNVSNFIEKYPDLSKYIEQNFVGYSDILEFQALIIIVIIGYVLINLYIMLILDFKKILNERTDK